jgi:hypothetical protein
MINSESIKGILKKLKTQNRLNRLSEEQKKKIEEKRARAIKRASRGIKVTSKKDGPMIPWLPFTYSGTKINLSPSLRAFGHGEKLYNASWIAPDKKVPGVKVSKVSGINGISSAVYTGGAYIVNNTKPNGSPNTNLYVTKRPLKHVNNRTNTKKLVRDRLQGPDVTTLSLMIEESGRNVSEKSDLYSYKLLGDRYTAEQCKLLNEPSNYIIKPYSQSFAKLIQDFVWAESEEEKQNIKNVMIKERDQYLPYYFEKGVVYTGDRPLFLYCLKQGIPCIIETNKQFVYTSSTATEKKNFNDYYKKNQEPEYQRVLECFESTENKKISVFDCLHDFAKGDRSSQGIEKVKKDLREIYKTDRDTIQFINKFSNSSDIINSEYSITLFLKTKEKLDENRLVDLFKNDLIDSCIMYDAGTNIPVDVYARVAATTQRITNGFYGAPAIRRLPNFAKMPNINRFNLPNLPNNSK